MKAEDMDTNMYLQDQFNLANEVLDGLSNEALAAVGGMFAAAAGVEGLAHYWKGAIDHRLVQRGACRACGADPMTHTHDTFTGQSIPLDTDDAKVTESPIVVSPHGSTTLAEWEKMNREDNERAAKQAEVQEYTQGTLFDHPSDIEPGNPVENILANAREWGVTLVDEANPFGPVVCDGCGQEYVSLEDRMLRPPGLDGCHFCQLKSRLG